MTIYTTVICHTYTRARDAEISARRGAQAHMRASSQTGNIIIIIILLRTCPATNNVTGVSVDGFSSHYHNLVTWHSFVRARARAPVGRRLYTSVYLLYTLPIYLRERVRVRVRVYLFVLVCVYVSVCMFVYYYVINVSVRARKTLHYCTGIQLEYAESKCLVSSLSREWWIFLLLYSSNNYIVCGRVRRQRLYVYVLLLLLLLSSRLTQVIRRQCAATYILYVPITCEHRFCGM